MNVRNIDDFIEDIDEEKIVEWQLEQDCHEKIKKIILTVEKILQEEQATREIQMTLERSQRPRRHLGHRPRKRWEVPDHPLVTEELVDEITSEAIKELGHPILYDGHFYYENEVTYK